MKLRAGVIGTGSIGKNHVRVLSDLQGIELVGSCDVSSSLGDTLYGKPVYQHLEELLRNELDYVVISVPTSEHHSVAAQVAEAGVNALIEKPLAIDSHTCIKIEKEFVSRKLLAAVGHIERFNPAAVKAKSVIDTLSPIVQISTRRQGPYSGRVSDVGVTKDLAIHDIDLVRWLSESEYESVSAYSIFSNANEHEDAVNIVAKLKNGTVVNHVVNWINPYKERLQVILGQRGSFVIDTMSGELSVHKEANQLIAWEEIARRKGSFEGETINMAFEKKEPLVKEHENFRDALQGKSAMIVSLQDGRRNLEVAEAILKSCKTNQAITLETP